MRRVTVIWRVHLIIGVVYVKFDIMMEENDTVPLVNSDDEGIACNLCMFCFT